MAWISRRLSIALGYAFEFAGGDVPASAVEEPFIKVAQIAGNLAPSNHQRSRNYQLTEHARKLLCLIDPKISNIPAELCAFVLDHAEVLSVEDVASEQFQRFNRQLNRYLNNGLNIDRLGEALRESLKGGYTVARALPYLLTIIDSTHGRMDRPWWFKEDFSFFGERGLSGFTLSEAAQLAKASGHAYEYCREVFRIKGDDLATTERFGRRSALRACAFIGRRYGIGNVDRAVRVLSYVESILKEHAGNSPHSALKMFFALAHHERPRSIALALYEGDRATLNIPGFFASFNTHLPEDSSALPDLTIPALSAAPEHFPHLLEAFKRPLVERAKLPPGVSVPRGRNLPAPFLIAYQAAEPKLLSGDVRNAPAPFLSTRPVSDFLAFNAQLTEEVGKGENADHVASTYFAFCAPKLPNPLHPPPGLLGVIERFSKLPTPGWDFPGLSAPSQRDEVADENRDKIARKYLLISHLLDAGLLGMVSFDEVMATLEWIVSPLPDSEVRRIQTEQAWGKRDETVAYIVRQSQFLHSELIRHRKIVEKLQRAIDKAQAYGEEICRWDLDELIFAKENVKRILAGKDPIRDRFRSPDETEYDDHFIRSLANPYPNEARPKRNHREYDYTIGEFTKSTQIDRMREVISILNASFERKVLFERGLIPEVGVTASIAEDLRTARTASRLNIGKDLPALISPHQPAQELTEQVDRLMALNLISSATIAPHYKGDTKSHRTVIQEILRVGQVVDALSDEVNARHDEARGGSRHRSLDLSCPGSLLADLSRSPIVSLPGSRIGQIVWPARYRFAELATGHLLKLPALNELSQDASTNLMSERDPTRAAARAKQSVVLTAFATEALGFVDSALTYEHPNSESSAPLAEYQIQALAAPANWHIELAEKFAARIPAFVDLIHQVRQDKFLLGPIGGKIHVTHPVSEEKLKEIKDRLGLSSTGFALIHAGHSLLLPPMPTPEELNYLIKFLVNEGIVDTRLAEVQYACSGRLPNFSCGILGSTVLLGSNTGVRYDHSSFSTNRNDETGMRMMVYDAGGPRTTYPFATSLPGRTDMLGRQDGSDAEIYQLVHTVLAHVATNGVLKELGLGYMRRHMSALRTYGLLGIMRESWVLDPRRGETRNSKSHFDNAIAPCVEAWFAANDRAQQSGQAEGIIKEVHYNLDWLKAQVRLRQDEALASPSYAVERKILLGFE